MALIKLCPIMERCHLAPCQVYAKYQRDMQNRVDLHGPPGPAIFRANIPVPRETVDLGAPAPTAPDLAFAG